MRLVATLACTNDIVEIPIFACVVTLMCVCYIQTLHPVCWEKLTF